MIQQLPFDDEPFDTEAPTAAEAMRGALAPGKRRAFVLAGNATVTIRSSKTGTRFTYRVQKSKENRIGQMPVWFVKLLNGPDNNSDYTYLGTIFAHGFRTTRASRISNQAPSFVAFEWLSRHWEDARVEVWHEGRCGRCGRVLTVPESIESGIGPTCAGK